MEIKGQGCQHGWEMKSGMHRHVKVLVRDVAGLDSRVLEKVGEFLKSLLGLQDVIKKFAVHSLHDGHLNCFMILCHWPSLLEFITETNLQLL